ncbi:MAG: hypothetical protein V4772_05765, partial [Pseudomonadota bacterium]
MKNLPLSMPVAAFSENEAGAGGLSVFCASVRMALVATAGVVAVGLMATGLTGCADMSGISAQSSLRDASSLGLVSVAKPAASSSATVNAEWWRESGYG